MRKITVGILTSSSETAERLRAEILATGMTTVVTQSTDYASSKTDWSARRIIEAEPEMMVLEVQEPAMALRCLQVLHTALPNTRFLVVSALTDPHLIIEAMRSGAREFLPLPTSQTALLQAFNRLIAETERSSNSQAQKRGKLFCTISAKRGSGATTLALNLAGIVADKSTSKTAMLDLDQPVGDTAAYLNLKPAFSLADAVAASHRLDSVLLESFMTPSNGFHLLSGFKEYTAKNQITTSALSQLLDVSLHTFAHTLADLPECLQDEQTQLIASMSSAILVVVTPDVPSIWRTERLLNTFSKLNAAGKINIILNRQSRSNEIADSDIEKLLQHPIFYTLPNDYSACMRAINSGRLLDASEGKYLVRALRELAMQLAGFPAVEPRRGLLSMFLKPSSAGGPSNA